MKGYVANIETLTRENADFRKVLYTTKFSQLVVMSLKPGEEIGMEVHDVDQFLRFEHGQGKAILNGVDHHIDNDTVVVVPAGVEHNVINTSENDTLKLYTLYTPPHHKDGTIHVTKTDAEADKEHFDGVTTEN